MAKRISIGDLQIAVTKKKIKNLYLSVYPPDGRVRVAAPLTMKDEAIREIVVAKLPWIRKQQSKLARQEWRQEKEYVSGESHYFMGRRYWLNVVTTKQKQRVELGKNNQLTLYVRPGSTKEQRKKMVTEWYRSELKKQIPALIAKWEKELGVRVNSWGVKLMKTRWGSCNPKAGRIWVNLELAKKSPRCLEYIVLHEMLHLLEKYHNKRFYTYLGQFMPDWKESRAELNG